MHHSKYKNFVQFLKEKKNSEEPSEGKIYMVEKGSTVDTVLGVRRDRPAVVALVRYMDEQYELVPTWETGGGGTE